MTANHKLENVQCLWSNFITYNNDKFKMSIPIGNKMGLDVSRQSKKLPVTFAVTYNIVNYPSNQQRGTSRGRITLMIPVSEL